MQRQIGLLGIILLSVLITPAQAAHKRLEKEYQREWCAEHHGTSEVTLADRTRADCLTAKHAIEFDFGPKWAEAIGQSLYYALQTNKKAGIVLILESEQDYKYYLRLNTCVVFFKLPITVWTIHAY